MNEGEESERREGGGGGEDEDTLFGSDEEDTNSTIEVIELNFMMSTYTHFLSSNGWVNGNFWWVNGQTVQNELETHIYIYMYMHLKSHLHIFTSRFAAGR